MASRRASRRCPPRRAPSARACRCASRAARAAAPTAVARAVGSWMTVLLDGGVRRGVDILKARALGAQAVLTGRATLFGVIAGGGPGARRALEILSSELDRAM